MLREEIKALLSESRERGWVMEPQAKEILSFSGMDVTEFMWCRDAGEAVHFADKIGYPVVVKVVSPDIIHKSDVSGVALGVADEKALMKVFTEMSTIKGFSGVLVEETLKGMELIAGMKMDQQFGPVILLGMGGTAVEIYKDVAIRMAPLREGDIDSMVKSIKAHPLLEGYRGAPPISMNALKRMLLAFSGLAMEFDGAVDSIDLNPVICNETRCIVADARIMLAKQ
ncbi:MAG: acetyl-CoA synthetase [Syntrophus sp. (in: bacteria)]|nr:acetyl-CoA synthetase [Syntrophus sp. (in: bacteria)]